MDEITRKRFEDKFIKKDEKSCWIWVGASCGKYIKYGSFRINGTTDKPHRIMYRIHKGQIPEGLWICHTCDNSLCINPNHLFLGTPADNAHDRDKKGRQVAMKGEEHGMSKLTQKSIIEIKASMHRFITAYHKLEINLAKKYGVTKTTIRDVRRGKTWKWFD
jgi:hypothetical protein